METILWSSREPISRVIFLRGSRWIFNIRLAVVSERFRPSDRTSLMLLREVWLTWFAIDVPQILLGSARSTIAVTTILLHEMWLKVTMSIRQATLLGHNHSSSWDVIERRLDRSIFVTSNGHNHSSSWDVIERMTLHLATLYNWVTTILLHEMWLKSVKSQPALQAGEVTTILLHEMWLKDQTVQQ